MNGRRERAVVDDSRMLSRRSWEAGAVLCLVGET